MHLLAVFGAQAGGMMGDAIEGYLRYRCVSAGAERWTSTVSEPLSLLKEARSEIDSAHPCRRAPKHTTHFRPTSSRNNGLLHRVAVNDHLRLSPSRLISFYKRTIAQSLSGSYDSRIRRSGPMKRKDFSGVTSRLQAAARESTAADVAAAGAQNLRSIQHLIDAIGRNDLDEAIANAHDDVRFEIYAPLEFQWIRQATGVKELKAALRHNFGLLAEQHPEITTLTAQGDTVVLIGREHGRVKATGEPYRMQFVQRFLFRDGRLASVTVIAAYDTSVD
jgi:ketosteroid isomerase-like protein